MRPSRTYQPARAFSLLELLIVIACLLTLAALILPALARPKTQRSGWQCLNNLKQVGLSFRTWSLDNQDHYPMQVSVSNGGTMELVMQGNAFVHFQVMSNELSTPKILICPQDL